MRIEKSPTYTEINRIKDPFLRSFVFAVVEDNWSAFYDKKIVGLTMDTAGWKGYDIVNAIGDEAESILNNYKKIGLKRPDPDIVFTLVFVCPAWIGPCLSKEERRGWEYLSAKKMYRRKDWKNMEHDWYMGLRDKLQMFQVSDKLWPLFMEILDRKSKSMETIIYQFAYHHSLRRK